MHLFTVFLLVGGIVASEPPPVKIKCLKNNAGIYYEPLRDVYVTQKEWKLVTYMNLSPYIHRTPSFAMRHMDSMNRICVQYLGDRCNRLMDKEEMAAKERRINKYVMDMKMLTDERLVEIDNTPMHYRITSNRPPLEILSTGEARRYNEFIKVMIDNNATDVIEDSENRAHIVRSHYQQLEKELTQAEREHDRDWTFITRGLINITRQVYQDIYAIRLMEWERSAEKVELSYQRNARSINDAILYLKAGFIHSDLIKLDAVKKAFVQITTRIPGVRIPISLDDLQINSIAALSRFSVKYYDEKVIVVIHIPLVNPTKYSLFKLHPYPTVQTIGFNNRSAAYVMPRASYLAVSFKDRTYALINEKEINQCYPHEDYQICSPTVPFLSIHEYPTCEVLILNDNSTNVYNDCDIKITREQKPYWSYLESSKEWLFSIVTTESFNVNEYPNEFSLGGKGKMDLKEGYTLFNGYMVIGKPPGASLSPQNEVSPGKVLNLTELVPDIATYELFKYVQGWPTVINHRALGALAYDISVSKLKKELMAIKLQKGEENLFQNHISASKYILIFLSVITALGISYLLAYWFCLTVCKVSSEDQNIIPRTLQTGNTPYLELYRNVYHAPSLPDLVLPTTITTPRRNHIDLEPPTYEEIIATQSIELPSVAPPPIPAIPNNEDREPREVLSNSDDRAIETAV